MVSPYQSLSHQLCFSFRSWYNTEVVSLLTAWIRSAGYFVTHLNIPTQPLQHPLHIYAIDGGPIEGGTINLCTWPLLLRVSVHYQEQISFLVRVMSKHPIILGFRWMQIHNPQISWLDKLITH